MHKLFVISWLIEINNFHSSFFFFLCAGFWMSFIC